MTKRVEQGILWVSFIVLVPFFIASGWRVYQSAKPVGPQTQSISRLRMLGTATLIYLADSEDVTFPRDFRTALQSYVRDDEEFRSPLTGTPFAFNPKLYGKSLAKVKNADRLILFYEADGNALLFTEGRAGVVFADSSARRVSRADAVDWFPKY